VQSGRPEGGMVMDVMHVAADEHDSESVAQNGPAGKPDPHPAIDGV
jgi:hypothetical protein